VLAAGAIAAVVFWPSDSSKTTGARVVPSVGPHQAALQLHFGF
jgi:hypothetical protein